MDKIKNMIVSVDNGNMYIVNDKERISEAKRDKEILVFYSNGNVYYGKLGKEIGDDGVFRLLGKTHKDDVFIKMEDIIGWAYKNTGS